MRLLLTSCLGLSLLFAAPAPAQTPAPASITTAADQAWLAWIGRYAEITAGDSQRLGALMAALKPIEADLNSPEKMRAHLPRMMALAAEGKTALNRSIATVTAMRATAPPAPSAVPLKTDDLLADGLRQQNAMVQLLDGIQAMLKAAAAGDQVELRKTLPVVAEGSVLLVDNQAAMYRTRAVMLSSDASVRIAMQMMASFYGAMGDTLRIGIYGRPPFDADVSVPRKNLATHARNTRSLATAGAAEVAGDLARLDALAKLRLSASDSAMLGAARRIRQGYAELFGVGDAMATEIAAVDARLGTGAIDRQKVGLSLGNLTAIEQRAVMIMQTSIANAGAAVQAK